MSRPFKYYDNSDSGFFGDENFYYLCKKPKYSYLDDFAGLEKEIGLIITEIKKKLYI